MQFQENCVKITKNESTAKVFVSKGNGLNAERGESPREPVTVKLQLREISQIRAWAWNKSDALSTVCFLPAGAPAGESAFVGVVHCESRFYFWHKNSRKVNRFFAKMAQK